MIRGEAPMNYLRDRWIAIDDARKGAGIAAGAASNPCRSRAAK